MVERRLDGHEVDGHDEGAGMFPAEESDDEITRPRRHIRNVVDSDDDDKPQPNTPTNTISGEDDAAPQDVDNPSPLW